MKCSSQRKCQHCKEFYLPDRRNLHHQRYCAEPACRRQSKAESQRRWVQKPENQNYFSGSQNSQRVKEWRKRNPGYWRKKSPPPQEPLQDLCTTQVALSHSSGFVSFSPAGKPTSLTMNSSMLTPLQKGILPLLPLDGPPQTFGRGPRSARVRGRLCRLATLTAA
jgi:hypothetical protein